MSFWHCKPTSYKIATHVQWRYLVNLGLTVKMKHGSMFLTGEPHGNIVNLTKKINLKLPKTDISEILSVHNHFLCCWIIAKFCTEHGSRTAVLCAQFCNDWANQKVVMLQRNLRLNWISGGYCSYPCFSRRRIISLIPFLCATWLGNTVAILSIGSANERIRYDVTDSFIGGAPTQNDTWNSDLKPPVLP